MVIRGKVIAEPWPVGEAAPVIVVAQYPEAIRRKRGGRGVPDVVRNCRPGEQDDGAPLVRSGELVLRETIGEPRELPRCRGAVVGVERFPLPVERHIEDHGRQRERREAGDHHPRAAPHRGALLFSASSFVRKRLDSASRSTSTAVVSTACSMRSSRRATSSLFALGNGIRRSDTCRDTSSIVVIITAEPHMIMASGMIVGMVMLRSRTQSRPSRFLPAQAVGSTPLTRNQMATVISK